MAIPSSTALPNLPPKLGGWTRALSAVRSLLLLLASSLIGVVLWNWPIQPLWEIPVPFAWSYALGFTPDHSLVCLETQSGALKSQLVVRHADTGAIIREFPLEQLYQGRCELSPDGEWALLRTSQHPQKLRIMSWRTGRLRYPETEVADFIFLGGGSTISPDGRYKFVQGGISKKNRLAIQLIDLESGAVVCQANDACDFSPDSRQWLSCSQVGDTWELVFRSIPDQRVLNRVPVPTSFQKHIAGAFWWNDRICLEVSNGKHLTETGFEVRTWSFEIQEGRLVDPRPEPAWFSSYDREGDFRTQTQAGHGWVARVTPQNRSMVEMAILQWKQSLRATGFPRQPLSSKKTTWQRRSVRWGIPISPEIEVQSLPVVSSDGTWIADGGKAVRVWRVRPGRRLIALIAGMSIPWWIWGLIRYWRNRSSQNRESTPTNT